MHRVDDAVAIQSHRAISYLQSSTPLCPLCGGNELGIKFAGVRDRLHHVTGDFNFFECRLCRSVSLFPLPDEAEIAAFYPPGYMVKRPTANGGLAGTLRRIEWKTLFVPLYRSGASGVQRMTGLNAGKILEIGCSSGYQLREFARIGDFRVQGLDIDPMAVEHARGELSLDVRNKTLHEADFPADSFDLVILFNVVEHLVDPLGMIEEIRHVLKPGGFLAIKTQIIDSLQGRVFGGRWMPLREAPRHVLLASSQGIRHLLERAGMGLVRGAAGPILENSVSLTLSILPHATSKLALEGSSRIKGLFLRMAGLLMGATAISLAIAETMIGVSGTMIYVARKETN